MLELIQIEHNNEISIREDIEWNSERKIRIFHNSLAIYLDLSLP